MLPFKFHLIKSKEKKPLPLLSPSPEHPPPAHEQPILPQVLPCLPSFFLSQRGTECPLGPSPSSCIFSKDQHGLKSPLFTSWSLIPSQLRKSPKHPPMTPFLAWGPSEDSSTHCPHQRRPFTFSLSPAQWARGGVREPIREPHRLDARGRAWDSEVRLLYPSTKEPSATGICPQPFVPMRNKSASIRPPSGSGTGQRRVNGARCRLQRPNQPARRTTRVSRQTLAAD